MGTDLQGVAIIGGGNMARAIVDGAAARGRLDPARCVVAEPDPDRRAGYVLGVADAAEAMARLVELEPAPGAGRVVLAVKPQVFGAVAAEIAPWFGSGVERGVLSMMAGIGTGSIRSALGEGARVVRAMPNTAASVGRAITAVCAGEGASAEDLAFAEGLMGSVGGVIRLEESLFDAFTALAGSGPAYVCLLVELMAKGGEAAGLPREQCEMIARRVVSGTGEVLARDPRSAEELRASVTSKGGTTEAALAVLDAAGVGGAFERAIVAARDRGRELGKA